MNSVPLNPVDNFFMSLCWTSGVYVYVCVLCPHNHNSLNWVFFSALKDGKFTVLQLVEALG